MSIWIGRLYGWVYNDVRVAYTTNLNILQVIAEDCCQENGNGIQKQEPFKLSYYQVYLKQQ